MDRLRFKDENNIIFPNPKLTKLSNVLIQGSKDKVEDTSKYKKITVMLNFKGIKFAEIEREMADTRPFYVRRTDEIIIGKQNYFNGSIALVSKEFDGTICSNAIMSFSVKQNSIPYFIYTLLSQNRFMRTREKLANGTGQKELGEKDFLNFDINLPSKQEQEKIGGFLSAFDKLIQKQQEKIGLLKELKKGYLQQMFPVKGSNKPKIRFKGFTEAWEQRTIGGISKLVTKGTTPIDKSGDGTINYVKVENIDSYSGEFSNLSKISEEEHNGYLRRSQLQDGDILFSIAGTLGRITTVSNAILPANTNQALAIIRLHQGNIRFIQTALKGKVVEDFVRRNPTVGAQPNLSLEQVKSLIIDYPNNLEQSKIGTFFDKLDNLITLHQRKLEELEEMKKGYMQRLF